MNDMDELMREEWLGLRQEALRHGARVIQYAIATLPLQRASANDRWRVAVTAMAVRIFKTHQAISKLVQSDLNDGAAALLRVSLEQYFVLKAVVSDPDSLNVAMQEALAEKRKVFTGLKEMPASERAAEITDAALDEAIEGIKFKSGFNTWNWAQRIDCLGLYHTLWRRLSAYAHGSLLAVESYLQPTPDGVGHTVSPIVEEMDSIEFVLVSASILADAVNSVDLASGADERRPQFDQLVSDFRDLQERFWVFKGAAPSAEK